MGGIRLLIVFIHYICAFLAVLALITRPDNARLSVEFQHPAIQSPLLRLNIIMLFRLSAVGEENLFA